MGLISDTRGGPVMLQEEVWVEVGRLANTLKQVAEGDAPRPVSDAGCTATPRVCLWFMEWALGWGRFCEDLGDVPELRQR